MWHSASEADSEDLFGGGDDMFGEKKQKKKVRLRRLNDRLNLLNRRNRLVECPCLEEAALVEVRETLASSCSILLCCRHRRLGWRRRGSSK